MTLTDIQRDRAAGTLVGLAVGDALGAGYEFGLPLSDNAPVEMKGGGTFGWQPGEWTDDTGMAIPIARVLARGDRLDSAASLNEIVAAWETWSHEAKDIGTQTRKVLSRLSEPTEAAACVAARAVHDETSQSGGNGSLMRTAPVALGYLDDEAGLAAAARRVSDLTHVDVDAGDACVLWSMAIRHAILTGQADVRIGLPQLPEARRDRWIQLVEAAEAAHPKAFSRNGWVVEAFQGAWSAIYRGNGLVDTLERAVRGGRDTDTVAAIAGGLVGATRGVTAIPARWRRALHGWPGLSSRDLISLAILAMQGGRPDHHGWPTAERFEPSDVETLVEHPHDRGVLLASLGGLDRLPGDVDVVVSLCRVGSKQTNRETIDFWLVDQPGANANLHEVLVDAADTVATLRREGKCVVIHCFGGQSRTGAVATLYAVRACGAPLHQAQDDLARTMPDHAPAPFLLAALRWLCRADAPDSAMGGRG